MKILVSCILFILTALFSFGQNTKAPSGNWTTNPFENKEFIENKGQFTSSDNLLTDPILFAINREGVQIYFTAKGLSYRHDEFKKSSEKEEGEKESEAKERVIHVVHAGWQNSNPDVKVTAEEIVPYYLTYPDPADASHNKTIIVRAFKKIIYKGLYPNIDVEYFFPENKEGFKYNIILHPGADASMLKMKYSKAQNVSMDNDGNIVVASGFGSIVDHAPASYLVDGKQIPSSFELNGTSITFRLNRSTTHVQTQTLIDPWVTPPTFTTNTAYDVDFDKYGNVFAYGSYNPYELVKINSGGAIVWKYTATTMTSMISDYYGDFVADYNTGRTYIFEGWNGINGSRAVKLDPAGVQLAAFPGNKQLTENWRAAYNCSNGTIVLDGGNSFNQPVIQGGVMDTSLSNVNPVNLLSGGPANHEHDESLLAVDKSGNCFMLLCQSQWDALNWDNFLLECPASTLLPMTWGVNSGHTFVELTSIQYVGSAPKTNAMNGMAVNNNFLLTYDGDILKKWNKANGTFIKQISVGGNGMFTWGGLDISKCEKIYAGVNKSINVYDSSLVLTSSIALPDIVYDVKVDYNRQLVYAVGIGYVAAKTITDKCKTDTLIAAATSTRGLCSSASATVTATGGSGNYIFLWSNGQTTQSISNLPAGTYTVTVTDKNTICDPLFLTAIDTVIIPLGGTLNATIASSPAVCGANNGTTTVTITTGTAPYTYSWSPSGGTNATATGLAPGNYSVTITDATGCSTVNTVSVTSNNVPPVANFSSSPVCIGVPTNFTDLSTGPPSSWNWTFGDGNTATTQNPANTYSTAGTYTVTLIATAGACGDTVAIPVTVNPTPAASFSNTTVCFNNATGFTDASTGNNTISGWSWNFGDGNTSTQQNPSHTYNAAGTYTASLVVTNNFGCKDSFPLITVVNPLPLASFSTTPVCLGASSCFSDLSTVTAPNTITGWSWNFGEAASGNNISNAQNPCHTFSSAGTFSVTLTSTSSNNCQSTTVLTVTVNPLPTAQFANSSPCLGAITSLTDGSTTIASDPITNWNWTINGGTPSSATTQNPTTSYNTAGTQTVDLIVTTKAGCKDTVDQQVLVHDIPVANFNGGGTGCAPLCSQYNDQSTSTDGTITSWAWSFPGGSPAMSNMQNPTNICYKTPGTYGASLLVTSSFGCVDTIKISPLITAYAWPTADFCIAPLQAPATDPVFTFCNQWSQDVVKWAWNFGDKDSDSVSTTPAHSYSATATANDFYNYNVCLKVQNQHGCWDTVCKTVELIPEFEFYIPNTFTPNGDGTNEFFFGKCRGVKEYNIWVFDRWGNLLWDCHHNDKNTNWDGTGQDGLSSFCKWDGVVVHGGPDMSGNGGTIAQQDVYVWKVKLMDIFNKQHDYIGHVSVVK